jgi:hypothetical protein
MIVGLPIRQKLGAVGLAEKHSARLAQSPDSGAVVRCAMVAPETRAAQRGPTADIEAVLRGERDSQSGPLVWGGSADRSRRSSGHLAYVASSSSCGDSSRFAIASIIARSESDLALF